MNSKKRLKILFILSKDEHSRTSLSKVINDYDKDVKILEKNVTFFKKNQVLSLKVINFFIN
jgi:hypothetical protein